ncbi:MAG: hypothetical protein WAP52_03800 [Candidatus Sungiibacteriota bacterium]
MQRIKRKKESKEERFVTEAYLDMRLEGLKKGYFDVRFDGMKTYIDERLYETRKGLKEEITEEMRGETVKILQAVDGIMTRFDKTEKEEAAHTALHGRITDDVHEHDKRIKKLELFTHIFP